MNQQQAVAKPVGRNGRRTSAGLAGSVVALSVIVGLVSGCSGSSGSSGSSGGVASSVAKAPVAGGAFNGPNAAAPDEAADGGASSGKASTAGSAGTVGLLQNRRLVLNTDIDVTVPDVFKAAARVRTLAGAADGYVGDEKTAGSGTNAQSALTLRVPQAQLGQLTDQVAALGKVTSRGQTSQDVTQQSIDVASRLATQKASVARIRALLARATRISDIVAIEGELSQRESNLESLEAQLKGLNDSVDLATLSVVLSPQGAPKKPVAASTGFGAGLHDGWDAFVGALVVALTVLGALLPFALTLALLGIPALVLWRRRRTVVAPTAAPVPES
jgi:Domain of unknown function (DUF4349)